MSIQLDIHGYWLDRDFPKRDDFVFVLFYFYFYYYYYYYYFYYFYYYYYFHLLSVLAIPTPMSHAAPHLRNKRCGHQKAMETVKNPW
jgi:hypothetical protein